ncbi:MAG: DUF1684 domain-containing protein [Proteobacteria bacterium]|nr:DUF1684 domain-containing protein [Pseudomonadota bacterium]HQR03552.1 DUF1684 domain-containing protein [Rhodocyclaceae bacterium]
MNLVPQQDDFAIWRAARLDALRDPEGWLSLIGLYWLTPGRHTVGAAADSAVVLPGGPDRVGEVRVEANAICWIPVDGTPLPLISDAHGTPTVVALGPWRLLLIERDGKPALRLKDTTLPALRAPAAIPCFDHDPAWRIDARWENGRAAFMHEGAMHTLAPQEPTTHPLHFVIGDRSNRLTSYGGGRFLYADTPVAGRVVLDFNRLINPPCVFTPYATCPLPPPGNHLPFAINAGEMNLIPTD